MTEPRPSRINFARRAATAGSVFACAIVLVLWALQAPAGAAYRPAFRARRFAVATDHAQASHAAAEVLRLGGNAADAAVTAALALGVVNAASSGFGGGGFATVCQPTGECTFVDFRETCPSGLTLARLQNAPDPAHASTIGALAVAVPGEPAGLREISRRFGRVPLARAAAPAIRLARQGFVVSDFLATQAMRERTNLARDDGLSALFASPTQALAAGARVRRPRLANTLEQYARNPETFIGMTLATAIARASQQQGGVITIEDVRTYRPVMRTPLRRTFRGLEVVSAPPPSAGGLILLEALAWLDGLAPSQLLHGSSAYDHALAEAWRSGFDDRARYVGDPVGGADAASALLDPARMARRRAAFDPGHAGSVVVIEPAHDHGTSHVCVADSTGMMVALTTTVNLLFGARVSVRDLDVVLNDEIDDFSLGTPGNSFGMAVASANSLAPGRRPVSSMTPTIVLQSGRPIACLGASGGSRIPTATTQVFLNMFVHGMDPEAAVSAPRVHHQGLPNQLLVDRETPSDVRSALNNRGHVTAETDTPLGVAQAIVVRTAADGGVREILAASDPRKGGEPAGE